MEMICERHALDIWRLTGIPIPYHLHWLSDKELIYISIISGHLLTYYAEQSSSREANRFLACREIPRIL